MISLKKPTKTLKLFTAITFVFLSGCQTEKPLAHSAPNAFTANKISFEAFKQQTGLTNFETTFKIPSKSTNLEGKTTDGKYELSDFDIDTDVVNSLEYQQKTTYSLQVHPKNEVSENYFNLILYKKNNVWEKTIVEMKPSADNLYELQNNLTDEFQGQMRQVYNSEVTTTSTMKCKTVTITSSNCQGCEGECDLCSLCVSVTIYNMCDFGGIPYTGGGGGGYSGSGGGGYGGSGGGGGIFVGPIPPSDDMLDPDTMVFDPNLQDPMSILDSQQAIKFNAFMNALQNTNLAAYNYLNQNPAIKTQIQNYLISNGFSVESKDFAKDFIEQCRQNPTLNMSIEDSYRSPMNIDRSAINPNTTEGAKFNEIYDKLANVPEFKALFIDMFQDDKRFNVKFVIEDLVTTTNGNCSVPVISNGSVSMTITINRYILQNRGNIQIAKSVLHECIHAFLFAKSLNSNNGIPIPGISNFDLTQMINNQYDCLANAQQQHNFMALHYIPTMVKILSDLKDVLIKPIQQFNGIAVPIYQPLNTNPVSFGNQVNWNWNEYFKYLSLNGLEESIYFKQEYAIFAPNFIVQNPINYYFYTQYSAVGEANFKQ
jgi:hypothetical protein